MPSRLPSPIQLGRFTLRADRRELLADGQVVPLGGRAFDLLCALAAAGGGVVSKDALVRSVWGGRIIDDNGIEAQVSALRKALGADRAMIRTAAGRGYFLVGAAIPPTAAPTNLRPAAAGLIDRAAAAADIAALLAEHRLVTLTGAGGIGKTQLAIEAGRGLLPTYPDGVWLAELDAVADPGLLAGSVAAALALALGDEASPARLARVLGDRRLLLLLDNCEHLLDAAAGLATALLAACPGLVILATSRERLHLPAERVFQVPPLGVPAAGETRSGPLLEAPAVQLLLSRAQAADHRFTAEGPVLAAIGAIARRLDGIPLALEMAAASLASLGAAAVAQRLDDRFRLLTAAPRGSLPRHRTLAATLDWSHALLDPAEQGLWRNLAVMAGPFTLEAACAVAAEAAAAPALLAALVAKSLVWTDFRSGQTWFRLPETMRVYAAARLEAAGDRQAVARRHARHFLAVFEDSETAWETLPTADWLARYAPHLGNARAALDWGLSPGGEVRTGVALAAALVPLWFHLALVEEGLARIRQALARAVPDAPSIRRCEMRLLAGLASGLLYTQGPGAATRDAWTRSLALARGLDSTDYQLRALWGLCVVALNSGRHRAGLRLGQRFGVLAARRGDRIDQLIGTRMVGAALHALGDQDGARMALEAVHRDYVPPSRRSPTIRFQFDQQVATLAFLARVQWLQGAPDAARDSAGRALRQALRQEQAHSICHALAQAVIPLALRDGDLAAAAQGIATLQDWSGRMGLGVWQAWASALEALLRIARGDIAPGTAQLRGVLEEHRGSGFSMYHASFLGSLAAAQDRAGQPAQAAASLAAAIAYARRHREAWCLPDLLRRDALWAHRRGEASAARFAAALDLARRQGAPAWTLRIGLGMAQAGGPALREPGLAALREALAGFEPGARTPETARAVALLAAPGGG